MKPALGLFVLAPLVGEFLLGNLPITWLWALLALAPLYGGGALLIRESARRLKLGWPGVIAFGLAYAVVEEAFVTASLFNRGFLGLNLLEHAYIPSLGIGAWWTVYVLTLHTVWSTAVPIALVESLTPSARKTPWLGWKGLVVTAVVFLLGCLATYSFQEPIYVATPAQYVGSVVVVVLLILLAVRLPRSGARTQPAGTNPPAPLATGAAALGIASAFMGLAIALDSIPPEVNVAGMIALFVLAGTLFWRWSRRPGWSDRHELAIAGGTMLAYAWYGFVQVPSTGPTSATVDAGGNLVFATAAVVLLLLAWRRVDKQPAQPA